MPERRTIPPAEPLVPVAYEGTYYGYVRIVASRAKPALTGMTVYLKASFGRLPTCAPYHVYQCASGILMDADAILEGSTARGANAMVIGKDAAPCVALRMRPEWDRVDIQYALGEALPQMSARNIQERLARRMLQRVRFPVVSANVIANQPWLLEHTDVGRAFLIAQLADAFIHGGKMKQKQRARMRNLTLAQLGELAGLLQREPWECIWSTVMDERFGGISPLDPDRYRQARDTRKLKEPAPQLYGVLIYFAMREEPQTDTMFPVDRFNTTIPCMPRDQRAQLHYDLRAYLTQRDVCYVEPRDAVAMNDWNATHLAIRDHVYDATAIINSLKGIRQRAVHRAAVPFLLRQPNEVPTVPPKLTRDQRIIAEHITQHWITVVLGSPGTGKTAIITWLMSHYKCALASGFVGMLVKMLQRRNGRRPELAYTMDALIYLSTIKPDTVASWLGHFEVLVIDECSNVSMGRLRKLLPLFRNLRKVVFVGDTYQCKSLKAGDALGDLAACFPAHTFRLTENLRVANELVALQLAPGSVLTGNWRGIGWGASLSTPIALVSHVLSNHGHLNNDKDDDDSTIAENTMVALYARLLAQYPGRGAQLLNHQILVLAHKGPYGRIAFNKGAQAALERLGVLDPRREIVVTIKRNLDVYAGCKITFTRNYNHPVQENFGTEDEPLIIRSDPVANGEIVIVQRIWYAQSPARGICMEVRDSHDPDAPHKTIWVESDGGVDPDDIEWGNATTVYKAQGREFPFVFFCVPPRPAAHWTRCYPYVAISRAQERAVVIGAAEDFGAMCARPDWTRRTVFAHMLKQEAELTGVVREGGSLQQERIIDDPVATLTPLAADQRAAPVLADFQE